MSRARTRAGGSARLASATTAAVHPGAADAPDDSFADSNCDGVDGSTATSVFVAPNGSDGAAGTRQAPLATIGAGIQKAKSLGRSAVLVRAGTYNGTVALADGIGLFGGYDAGWTRSAAATTTIKSTIVVDSDRVVALDAQNIKTATRAERFRIETGALTAGYDSIAARVVGSPGLRLEDSLLIAGDGGAGAGGMAGTDGVDATEPGKHGHGGTCDFNASSPGGVGGSWCSDESGEGGDGGDGGAGGKGGRGGGGAGGPSYGIFRSGTTVATAGNAITFSSPGAGGAPNGLAGATGAVN